MKLTFLSILALAAALSVPQDDSDEFDPQEDITFPDDSAAEAEITSTPIVIATPSPSATPAITERAIQTVFTTTSVSYSMTTLPTPECGALAIYNTVPGPDYKGCMPGCSPIQVPGFFAKATGNAPWICSARHTVETKIKTATRTSTCGHGSTVRKMTPLYGAVWPKCTKAG